MFSRLDSLIQLEEINLVPEKLSSVLPSHLTPVLSRLVSFPDRIFRARRENGSGQLPIPFSFKCAGMLAHCSFLI